MHDLDSQLLSRLSKRWATGASRWRSHGPRSERLLGRWRRLADRADGLGLIAVAEPSRSPRAAGEKPTEVDGAWSGTSSRVPARVGRTASRLHVPAAAGIAAGLRARTTRRPDGAAPHAPFASEVSDAGGSRAPRGAAHDPARARPPSGQADRRSPGRALLAVVRTGVAGSGRVASAAARAAAEATRSARPSTPRPGQDLAAARPGPASHARTSLASDLHRALVGAEATRPAHGRTGQTAADPAAAEVGRGRGAPGAAEPTSFHAALASTPWPRTPWPGTPSSGATPSGAMSGAAAGGSGPGPGPGDMPTVTLQATLAIDGRALGRIVSGEQSRRLGAPPAGGRGLDLRAAPLSPGLAIPTP